MTAQGKVLLCVENDQKAREYCEALVLAGLPADELIVLTPDSEQGDLQLLAATSKGLVLAGGPDIHPRHFGEEPIEGIELSLDEELDRIELEVLAGAEKGRTPIWAICRGMQTVNVFLGGTLWQDLPSQLEGTGGHDHSEPLDHIAHEIERIDTDSPLGAALERHGAGVNSRHHQAVKDLAPDLREVAWSPDGVLESLDSNREDWWIRAVQWHPENLTAMAVQLELWHEFLAAAEESRP